MFVLYNQTHMHIFIYISLSLPKKTGCVTRSPFKQGIIGFYSEFCFCHTKFKEPSLSFNLPVTGWRVVGFIPFPRVLVQCEMQLRSTSEVERSGIIIIILHYDFPNFTDIID